ncbi:hypothetical protein OS493_002838 [Desmophyllum pertusum]|uniref:Uncharacterized protein n=1 Tax=Desmophyllum pertusum TaxID=174260 RepID=A0A9W9YJ78_9CNID|nr:hypothetical protein OS493_002838 [Desmophyllum pertusum]
MRHLRLNKPQYVTKGMFLEPLTEELEVSSVGSGTVRTKISRKLSNEEGTIIIREESFEQGNLESELSLDVPITGHEQVGFDSNELKETTVSEQVENESQIVVNLEAEEATSISHAAEGVMDYYSAKSSSDVVDLINYSIDSQQCTSSTSECSDNNKQDLSRDVGANAEEEVTDFLQVQQFPAHLKVASIVVQDSFELEEIGNEEFNEKESSSTDQESGLILVKSLEKRLTRENSGESSGFEEMLPDKESASPNSSSPVLNTKRLPAVSRDLISDRRPLEALLDREMLSLAVEEKSPRATFGQRRTKSLTKQRPIDEDTFASWVSSPRSSAPNYVAESLGTSISREDSTVTSDSYVGETDENYNRTSKNGPEKLSVNVEPSALENSDNSQGDEDTATSESFEDATLNNGSLQDNNSTAIKLSELSSCLQNEMTHNGEESISPLTKEEFNSQRNITENKEYVLNKTDATFHSQGDAINTHIEQQTQSSRDLLSRGKLLVTSLPEDNEAVGACAEVRQREESQKALRKVDSEYQQTIWTVTWLDM